MAVFRWTDTTPVDFILWMRGEPNDYYGGERCVELYGLRGGKQKECLNLHYILRLSLTNK